MTHTHRLPTITRVGNTTVITRKRTTDCSCGSGKYFLKDLTFKDASAREFEEAVDMMKRKGIKLERLRNNYEVSRRGGSTFSFASLSEAINKGNRLAESRGNPGEVHDRHIYIHRGTKDIGGGEAEAKKLQEKIASVNTELKTVGKGTPREAELKKQLERLKSPLNRDERLPKWRVQVSTQSVRGKMPEETIEAPDREAALNVAQELFRGVKRGAFLVTRVGDSDDGKYWKVQYGDPLRTHAFTNEAGARQYFAKAPTGAELISAGGSTVATKDAVRRMTNKIYYLSYGNSTPKEEIAEVNKYDRDYDDESDAEATLRKIKAKFPSTKITVAEKVYD